MLSSAKTKEQGNFVSCCTMKTWIFLLLTSYLMVAAAQADRPVVRLTIAVDYDAYSRLYGNDNVKADKGVKSHVGSANKLLRRGLGLVLQVRDVLYEKQPSNDTPSDSFAAYFERLRVRFDDYDYFIMLTGSVFQSSETALATSVSSSHCPEFALVSLSLKKGEERKADSVRRDMVRMMLHMTGLTSDAIKCVNFTNCIKTVPLPSCVTESIAMPNHAYIPICGNDIVETSKDYGRETCECSGKKECCATLCNYKTCKKLSSTQSGCQTGPPAPVSPVEPEVETSASPPQPVVNLATDHPVNGKQDTSVAPSTTSESATTSPPGISALVKWLLIGALVLACLLLVLILLFIMWRRSRHPSSLIASSTPRLRGGLRSISTSDSLKGHRLRSISEEFRGKAIGKRSSRERAESSGAATAFFQ